MNIGIINPFPFRPHNQNLVFIVNYLKKLENVNLFFAECDGSPKLCYNKLIHINKRSNFITCLGCKTFGLKSYLNESFTPISVQNIKTRPITELNNELILSSLFTYNRSETPSEIKEIETDKDFIELNQETDKFRIASKNWILDKKLNAVIGFNGRIDLLKAVRIACIESSINFISVESPWFGKGLLLTPNESPSGISQLIKIYNIFKNKPLTRDQINDVYQPILKRFKKINKSEHKQFNKDHIGINWEDLNKNSTKKILFLPSSRAELLGDVQVKENAWDHPLSGLEYLIENNLVCKDDIIIRFHPIWAQEIFNKDGNNIINYYESFCKKNKIKYIKSNENVDTNFLINQADLLIINGSSSFFEASLIGKPVLSLSKAFYDCSNIALNFHSKEDFPSVVSFFNNEFKVDKKTIIRKTIRFLFTFKNRFTQFVDNVSFKSAFDVCYNYENINNNIIHVCKTGNLIACDNSFATSEYDEDEFLNEFLTNNLDLNFLELIKDEFSGDQILRKPIYRIIDKIHKKK